MRIYGKFNLVARIVAREVADYRGQIAVDTRHFHGDDSVFAVFVKVFDNAREHHFRRLRKRFFVDRHAARHDVHRRFYVRRLQIVELGLVLFYAALVRFDRVVVERHFVLRSVVSGKSVTESSVDIGNRAFGCIARKRRVRNKAFAVRAEQLDLAYIDVSLYLFAADELAVERARNDKIILHAGNGGVNRFEPRIVVIELRNTLDIRVALFAFRFERGGRNSEQYLIVDNRFVRNAVKQFFGKFDDRIAEHNRERAFDGNSLCGDKVVIGNAHERKFGRRVEQVRMVGCKIHLDFFALLERVAGIDARNGVVLFTLDIEIKDCFVSEVFDNVDSRLDNRFGMRVHKRLLVVHILGTNTQKHLAADNAVVDNAQGARLGYHDLVGFADERVKIAVFLDEFCFKYVHLRRAQEASYKQVGGVIVKRGRRIYLLDNTVFHNDDTRAHGHSLGLVVRDVNKRRGKTVVNFGNLGTHLNAQFCVEVGQRLVQKEYFRFADDSSSERDTLTLTARQSLGSAAQKVLNTEYARRFLHLFVYYFGRNVAKS